jgi:HSP20 family protein
MISEKKEKEVTYMFGLIPWRRSRSEGAVSRFESPFELVRRDFDTVFDRFFGGWPLTEPAELGRAWGVDWTDSEKEMVLRAELPGFEPAEINLEVSGDVLTITAEHKVPEGEAKKETLYRQMKRSFTLPAAVTADTVEAVYRHGILEVHLPKRPEVQSRKIEVKT